MDIVLSGKQGEGKSTLAGAIARLVLKNCKECEVFIDGDRYVHVSQSMDGRLSLSSLSKLNLKEVNIETTNEEVFIGEEDEEDEYGDIRKAALSQGQP